MNRRTKWVFQRIEISSTGVLVRSKRITFRFTCIALHCMIDCCCSQEHNDNSFRNMFDIDFFYQIRRGKVELSTSYIVQTDFHFLACCAEQMYTLKTRQDKTKSTEIYSKGACTDKTFIVSILFSSLITVSFIKNNNRPILFFFHFQFQIQSSNQTITRMKQKSSFRLRQKFLGPPARCTY